MDELTRLEEELADVMKREDGYLADYGYESKDEVVRQIREDIEEVKAEMGRESFDYSEEELEEERTRLCMQLGIARYC